MEKRTTVVCFWCNKETEKASREVTRILKRGKHFFCSSSCAVRFGNSFRNPYGTVTKVCALCGAEFTTSENPNKMGRFCSRSCASKASTSLTEKRIEAARASGRANSKNLFTPVQTLKKREMWKYAEMEKALALEPHEFEFALGNSVFDLLLSDLRILVEFDGHYHRDSRQKERDEVKSEFAKSQGYCVVRINTDDTQIIPSSVLNEVLQVMEV